MPQDHIVGELKVRLNIPMFDAHPHIEDYLDQKQNMDSMFCYKKVPQDHQLKYVAYNLW